MGAAFSQLKATFSDLQAHKGLDAGDNISFGPTDQQKIIRTNNTI